MPIHTGYAMDSDVRHAHTRLPELTVLIASMKLAIVSFMLAEKPCRQSCRPR